MWPETPEAIQDISLLLVDMTCGLRKIHSVSLAAVRGKTGYLRVPKISLWSLLKIVN